MNTSMVSVVKACWNHTGSLLAFAGILSKEIFGVQFYNTFGQVRACIRLYIRLYISAIQDSSPLYIYIPSPFLQHLYTLKAPGKSLCSVAWEGNGLRLALGIGPFIYFANIRHDYKVCNIFSIAKKIH